MDDRRPGHIRVTQVRGRERTGKVVALRIGRTMTAGKVRITRVENAKNGDMQLLLEPTDGAELGRVEVTAG